MTVKHILRVVYATGGLSSMEWTSEKVAAGAFDAYSVEHGPLGARYVMLGVMSEDGEVHVVNEWCAFASDLQDTIDRMREGGAR